MRLIAVLAVGLVALIGTTLTPQTGVAPLPAPTPTLIPAGSQNTTWQPHLRQNDRVPLVYVPAGCFMMGSVDGDDDESPVHEVCLHGYWIGQTEVTNAQYRTCVNAGACTPPQTTTYYTRPAYADHPVIYVTWEQARAFAAWAGGDLPTEVQWEYAARGPQGSPYPWGSYPPTCDLTNMRVDVWGQGVQSVYVDCVGEPATVGSFARDVSWVGALDMAGNVREWVSDWYDPASYTALGGDEAHTAGLESGYGRALRGGAWNREAGEARAANRSWFDPANWNINVGFRVVLTTPLAPLP